MTKTRFSRERFRLEVADAVGNDEDIIEHLGRIRAGGTTMHRDRSSGLVVVDEPERGNPSTAGVGVRYDPDPAPHETKATVEQLWAPIEGEESGRAEPVYIDEDALDELIHELMVVSLAIKEADDV